MSTLWPTSDVLRLTAIASTNKKLDFTAVYFENKAQVGSRYGWRTEAWYRVKQPVTPRAFAKLIWSQWERRYADIQPFLAALANRDRDPAARTRQDWNKHKAIIDLALAGWSTNLSATETHNFWTSLAELGMRLNAVQGVPTNDQLIADSIKDCARDYTQCLKDARDDLGLPKNLLPDFGAMFTMMKLGFVAMGALWIYGQLKGSRR